LGQGALIGRRAGVLESVYTVNVRAFHKPIPEASGVEEVVELIEDLTIKREREGEGGREGGRGRERGEREGE